jgi:hypothetical protein
VLTRGLDRARVSNSTSVRRPHSHCSSHSCICGPTSHTPCTSQSNMEYTVGGFPAAPGAQDAVTNATNEIAAAANFPLIRVMTVGQLYVVLELSFIVRVNMARGKNALLHVLCRHPPHKHVLCRHTPSARALSPHPISTCSVATPHISTLVVIATTLNRISGTSHRTFPCKISGGSSSRGQLQAQTRSEGGGQVTSAPSAGSLDETCLHRLEGPHPLDSSGEQMFSEFSWC